MIFYLTNSLLVRENDIDIYKSIFHSAIRNIAISAIQKSHSIFGDYEILECCAEMFNGDEEIYGFFRSLVNNWSSTPIPTCVTYYMEIVRDNPHERNEGQYVISQRQIDDFCNHTSTIPSHLICEDETDFYFYQFVAEKYLEFNNVSAFLQFTNDACHGCTQALTKSKEHIKLNQTCLCILDSDKTYATKPIKKAALDCLNYLNRHRGTRCVVLNVHEVENLLPINYLGPAVKLNDSYKYKEHKDNLRCFEYLLDCTNNELILPYFDYKNGIKFETIKSGDEEYVKFAKLCWSQNPEISKGVDFDTYLSNLSDKDYVYNRLNREVLNYVLSYLSVQKTNNSLVDPVLLRFQNAEWNRLGQEMLNWGYACNLEAVS